MKLPNIVSIKENNTVLSFLIVEKVREKTSLAFPVPLGYFMKKIRGVWMKSINNKGVKGTLLPTRRRLC